MMGVQPSLQSIEILTHFEGVTDPRRPNARHALSDLIVIALCAAICGANTWVDVARFGREKRDWFRRFLELEHGIPSHDTFSRVFARLDTGEFLGCLQSWVAHFQHSLQGEHVALDGKTLRGSFDRAEGQPALHLVSAWASGLRLSLGHVAVDDKSNEIPAAVQLLNLLELQGAVVTLDAMHCQKETAATIRRRGADYVLSVKGNQPTLHESVQQWFTEQGEHDFADTTRHVTLDRKRGERREYYCLPAPRSLQAAWPGVQSVLMVYRQRTIGGELRDETAYFLSSLPPKVRRLAHYVRAHWRIENSLHWVLDVNFSEDDSRIRKGHGPEIASVFRRLALMILQQDTSLKENLRGKRIRAGWNNDTLEGILCGKSA
jgi:predicted transposase YbfD/YdcC